MTCVASPPLYWVGFHWGNVSLESFFSRIRLPASILVTILLASTTEETKKKCTLNVNVSRAKVLMGTLFLRLLMQTGLPFCVIIWTTWRSSNLQGKDSTFNSQLFQGPEKCSRTWNRPPHPPSPPLQSRVLPTDLILPQSSLHLSQPWKSCTGTPPACHVLSTHHDWPIKNANMFVWPICLKGIRKHTSGDSWVHWGSGLEQGSHCYYLSGT